MAELAESPPRAVQVADLPIGRVKLSDLTGTARFRELDKREAYYRCRQYEGMRYDWDGNFQSYGGEADIAPGWYVPLKRRRPDVRMELPRTIVLRFTAMLFGLDRWPELQIADDPEAEDYARELVKLSKLPTKMIEARNLGGAMGTACLSLAFVNGRPRIQVHKAKNCTVMAWADPDDHVVGSAVEAYRYKRTVWEEGKPKERDFYYVRIWNETAEILFAPIPAEIGNQPGWAARVPNQITYHGFGFCPFYWIQNLPDSYEADGEGDFEGLEDDVDAINRLRSSTNRGTTANVDPTLVVHMDPARNTGNVQKGSGKAIFSEKGAAYLEIQGAAVEAAKMQVHEMRSDVLEAASCVIPDPDSSKAGVVSGEALRIRYAPMSAKCDLLRVQYGDAVIRIVADMMRVARDVAARPPAQVFGPDGRPTNVKASISVPPRIEKDETGAVKRIDRNPGISDRIELNWMPYFPHTWADIKSGIEAATTAVGKQPVASRRTAVQMVASMTGVKDVDAELAAIDEDAELATQRMQDTMQFQAEVESENAPPPKKPEAKE